MRRLIVLAIAGVVFVSGMLVGNAGRQFRYDAVIRCREQLQEDSAAHVKLVRYGDGHIVYRCTARGY